MKFTIQEVVELLKEAGVPHVEIVDKDSDFNKDEALSAIDKSRTEIIKPQIEGNIKEEAMKAASSTLNGQLSSALHQLTGISRSEFMACKTDKERFEKAIGKLQENIGKDAQGLQDEMKNLMETHKKNVDDLKEEYETKLKASHDKYTEREMLEALVVSLKDAPLPKGTDRTQAAKLLKGYLSEKYALNFDDNKKELSLGLKDNPTSPVYLNEQKTAFRKPIDDAKDFFTPLGLWAIDTRNENPKNHMPANNQNSTPPANSNQPIHPIKAGNDALLEYFDTKQAS